jgi:GTP pyrophosphokinase
MRKLLGWQKDVAGSIELPESTHIYAMTPQGRVIELPKGSTAIDFAYHVHSDLGHRCRGAKVNGQLLPLTTPLQNGQSVEIVASKSIDVSPATALLNLHAMRVGPSRDWLNPQLGFLTSARAKTKVRQWFNALEEARVNSVSAEPVAVPIVSTEPFARGDEAKELLSALNKPRTHQPNALKGTKGSDVLVVGVDFLMTQLAKCCRPLPPNETSGFVTRGIGISIHRKSCKTFQSMAAKSVERVLPSTWEIIDASVDKAAEKGRVYPVEVLVQAYDRQGLLRDISDTLAREKMNVIGASTQSKDQVAYMRFTIEVPDLSALQRALKSVMNVASVFDAKRRA